MKRKRLLWRNVHTKKSVTEGIEEKENTENSDEIVDSVDQSSLKRKRKWKRKRKGVEKKRKKNRKDLDMRNDTVDFVDYTAQLPETIIHHILSLLPRKKDVVCTSLLSKRWRRMWVSYSGLEIDERKFEERVLKEEIQGNKSIKFREFVHQSVQNHFAQKPTIKKFKLHISSYDSELASHMDKWIGFAVQNKVTELDLCVRVEKKARYCLPEAVLASKSLTGLRLSGCKWKDIKLSNLNRLCLREVNIREQNIKNLILSCPSIEDMRFVKCRGLRSLQVSSPKLNRVEVYQCHGLKKIEFVAPKLHTFSHSGKKSMLCSIVLAACKSLKVLTLEDYDMKDSLFQNQFSGFPVLEKLELSRCNLLRSVKISGEHLKRIALRECKRLHAVKFDTPNLLSFEYMGDKMIFSSVNSSRLEEAKLSISQKNQNHLSSWFQKIRNFLKNINSSEDLKMVIRSKMGVVIHEGLQEIAMLSIFNDLHIEILKSSNLEELCDRVLEQWQPNFLTIVSPPSSKFSTIAYNRIHGRDQKPSCCRYKTSNRCWRHYLAKDLKLEEGLWLPWFGEFRPEGQQVTTFLLPWTSRRRPQVYI